MVEESASKKTKSNFRTGGEPQERKTKPIFPKQQRPSEDFSLLVTFLLVAFPWLFRVQALIIVMLPQCLRTARDVTSIKPPGAASSWLLASLPCAGALRSQQSQPSAFVLPVRESVWGASIHQDGKHS